MALKNNIGGLSGEDYTLFFRVFGGEVLNAYNKAKVVADKGRTRTISSGKSAAFPVISTEEAKVHTPGENLLSTATYDSDMSHSEVIVPVQKALVAKAFVDEVEELMSHYDVRAPYAEQVGAALATAHERWALAALLAGTWDGSSHSMPQKVTPSGASTAELTVALMKQGIQDAAGALDAGAVPKEGRYVVVEPAMYYELLGEDDVVSVDFGTGADRGKAGSLWYMGFEILNSAQWSEFAYEADLDNSGKPLENITVGRTSYDVDGATGVGAIAFQRDALGTVVLKGLSTSVDYLPEYQGNLLVAKQAVGIGALRNAGICRICNTSAS